MGLFREPFLTTELFPCADNQSEYSVGSEEEDEDFDERPEGDICFPDFLPQLFPFHFLVCFKPIVFTKLNAFFKEKLKIADKQNGRNSIISPLL